MELSYQAMLTKGHPAEIHVASIIASQKAIDHIKMYFLKTRQQSGAQPSIPNSTNILTLFRDWAMRAILPMVKKNKRLKILPICCGETPTCFLKNVPK